jgi:hypothetical protein
VHLSRMTCCFAASLALVACGSSDPTTTDTQQATSAVMYTAALSDSFAAGNGTQVSGDVAAIGAAAQSIVQPDYGDGAYRELGPEHMAPMVSISATERLVQTLFNTGTCECVGDSCTFDGCGSGDGSWVINGSISRSGDTYTFDLDMQWDTEGISWSWGYSGSITITATSISGSLSGSGDGTFEYDGGSFSYSFDWSVDYNDVALDAQGCPVGGSVKAQSSYKVKGQGASGSFSGSGTVTFGPACGEATAS